MNDRINKNIDFYFGFRPGFFPEALGFPLDDAGDSLAIEEMVLCPVKNESNLL